jgi:hypothetical protein
MARATGGVSVAEQREQEAFLEWRGQRLKELHLLRIDGLSLSFIEYLTERSFYIQEKKNG